MNYWLWGDLNHILCNTLQVVAALPLACLAMACRIKWLVIAWLPSTCILWFESICFIELFPEFFILKISNKNYIGCNLGFKRFRNVKFLIEFPWTPHYRDIISCTVKLLYPVFICRIYLVTRLRTIPVGLMRFDCKYALEKLYFKNVLQMLWDMWSYELCWYSISKVSINALGPLFKGHFFKVMN